MTAVTLTLKTELRQRLDLSPLLPDVLGTLNTEQIASLELLYGNRRLPVSHFFDLTAHPGGDALTFARGDVRFDRIGYGMAAGSIHVAGDAGAYLGHGMRGGTIAVDGNVGIYCGAEMKDGEIRVRGAAGNFLGGALPGDKKGMAGGVIVIGGAAGDRAGDHMRRGLIVIEGDAGAYAASRMTAGTIAVAGRVGPYPGYAMQRGTLLLTRTPAFLSATFNDCGTHTLGFLPLLLRSRQFRDTSFARLRTPLRVRRYAGDQALLGKGEILVLA